MKRLWDKGVPVDDLVLGFTVGNDHELDARLVAYDVVASIAHARMLHEQGYLEREDYHSLRDTLKQLAAEHAAGHWQIAREEEDAHTALERRLVERCGEAGGRIHLGRSRNDQVLVALRLYLKDVVRELAEGAASVVAALRALASGQGTTILPGYTHLQRAMPSSVALWADGYAAEIEDDAAGLNASIRRLDRCPLGSAAGYGTPGLEIDRERCRELLDFAEVHEPVTAVQLSRGKAESQVVFELTLLMQDLGRLAADVCLFATTEFALLRLPEAFTTGSSVMPQKRNPDIFELVRARSAQLPGELAMILAITQKMPSGYHRDLQLIKAPLFRAIDSTRETLAVMAHAIPGLRFDSARAAAAAHGPGMDATTRAWKLVATEGLSFREAYRRVADELRRGDAGEDGTG